MGPKRAGKDNTVNRVDFKLVHKQPRAGIERGFGHLDFADVAIGDGDLRPTVGRAIINQIGIGAPIGKDICAACLLCCANQPGCVDDAVNAHLSDHLDNARTTDPGDTGGGYGIGKAFLVNRLQTLLQHQRIHLPAGHKEAGALVEELLNYEIRVGENASAKFGAFRTGTHDDLVTALGLAVQTDSVVA